MKVSDLLESRQTNWQELERLCAQMEGSSRRTLPAQTVTRFAALYRSVCADLALANSYQLPSGTIQYLHRLVGRAHNQLYRSRTFTFGTWAEQLLIQVPQQLFADNCLRLAFCVFWGIFLVSAFMAYSMPGYAEQVMGKAMIMQLEESYSQPMTGRDPGLSGGMVGFYIFNNTSIGLRCFAFGLLFGVGGLFATTFNAAVLGAAFGYMANMPQRENFFNFVTAHGPFELTAIVLSAAAGMRLGFSIVFTRGLARTVSLRRAAKESLPTMGAAGIMFALAALIEGFLSPSATPYWVKAAVAVFSAGALMFYFVILGYPRGD